MRSKTSKDRLQRRTFRFLKGYKKESAQAHMDRREPIIEEWEVKGSLYPGTDNE
jgi:hypothetical protein